ncbi:MAG TPA: hypothetical protein DCX46_01170 [Bacteroidetes bacterium]|nr:hypothetical protein [Bacteroidota bacterium]
MRVKMLILFQILLSALPLRAMGNSLIAQEDSVAGATSNEGPWTERKILSVVLSTVIPGAGQTYLGHAEKGAAFTIGTLASALIAGLSENNIVGRNERLDELKIQYSAASNYVGADTLWSKMVSTKSILDKDVRRRDLFMKIAGLLWVANLVDIVLFTDDRGEKPFGVLETKRTTLAIVPNPKNGLNASLTIRF